MSHPKRLVNPALAAITLVLAGALPACSGETVDPDLQGVASVIDGDTIEIHGTRIRLNGIDAPESGQRCQNARGTAWRCGQQAALALSDRIGRRQVNCQQTDTDRYGRVVADCFAGGENLNRWMVREGWAVAYRQYSTAYIAAEDDARTGQRGIWQGRFDMPWDWRAERRSGQNVAPTMQRLYEFAGQNWSCGPRRTCSPVPCPTPRPVCRCSRACRAGNAR